MILTKEKLRNELLKKNNNYRTDIQLVFNTKLDLKDPEGNPWSDKRKVSFITDKIEETVHRTNLKLCRYFLKRPESRIHFVGFIEGLKGINLHCHALLKIPPIYSDDEVIRKLRFYFLKLVPTGRVYRGEYIPELYFQNTKYSTKEYEPNNENLTYIYL